MEVAIIFVIVGAVILFVIASGGRTSDLRQREFPAQNNDLPPFPHPQKHVFNDHKLTVELAGRCFVVDGDTIVIDGQNIRLAGIDAPEMDHPYGKNAKWHLVQLTKGHKIKAVFHGEQTHAREVATCYLPDGRDLSAEMVKAGFAIDWPKFSGGKYRHLEVPDARRKMWRADARQKGRWPPPQS